MISGGPNCSIERKRGLDRQVAVKSGTVALPEGVCDVFVLGRHRENGEFTLVEREALTHILHNGCQGEHDVGEGVAMDRAEVGVGDVFELGAFEVAVGGFDDVAHSVGAAPFFGAVRLFRNARPRGTRKGEVAHPVAYP